MSSKTVKHINVGEDIPDSATWQSEALHELPVDTILIVSNPPDGFEQVKNIYLKESDQEFILLV